MKEEVEKVVTDDYYEKRNWNIFSFDFFLIRYLTTLFEWLFKDLKNREQKKKIVFGVFLCTIFLILFLSFGFFNYCIYKINIERSLKNRGRNLKQLNINFESYLKSFIISDKNFEIDFKKIK